MRIRFNEHLDSIPAKDKGVGVFYGPAKRTQYRLRWFAILLLVFSPVAFVLWFNFHDYVVLQSPAVIVIPTRTVVSSGDGFVEGLPEIGTEFSGVDEAILHVRSPELDALLIELDQQSIALENDEAALNRQSVLLTSLTDQSKVVKAALNRQQSFVNRMSELHDGGVVSAIDFAEARQVLVRAQLDEMQSRMVLNNAEAEYENEQIFGASATALRLLDQDRVQLLARQAALETRTHGASLLQESFVENGDWVVKGQPLVKLVESEVATAVAYMDPSQIKYAESGTQAKLYLPDGRSIGVVVSENLPSFVDALPDTFSTPLRSGKQVLHVPLELIDVPDDWIMLANLPVKVSWRTPSMAWRKLKETTSAFMERHFTDETETSQDQRLSKLLTDQPSDNDTIDPIQ